MDDADEYVRTILVRTFLGERRSPWFRRVLLPGVQADGAAVCADPDAVLDVREALAAIPPRQRATLVLRFYCDLDDAAIVLGYSAGTVIARRRRAWPPCAGCWNQPGEADLIVDEAGVRTLLGRLADTESPPARIDLDAAIARGGAGAAGGGCGRASRSCWPGGRRPLSPRRCSCRAPVGPAACEQPTGGPAAPARFNPLVPYAKFGWLPPGFQVGVRGGTMSRSGPEQLLLDAFSGSNAIIQLFVYPPGICHVGHDEVCSAYDSSQPVLSRRPTCTGTARTG